jgi:hypothetical protein
LLNREACKSILNFLSDIFDLSNSSEGKYRELINAIVLQRGATLTRIMIAALTGALPSGRLEEVCLLFMPDMVFFSVDVPSLFKRCEPAFFYSIRKFDCDLCKEGTLARNITRIL